MCFTTVSLHCLMVTIFFRLHVMSYQRCAGREEEIKFNLQDFWLDSGYKNEAISNLPWYHPYVMWVRLICKFSMNIKH